ncbi:uncharacterized protein [Dipodomys merriami]|uniref:uncharacterized protein n=1 Tax=Dipodomys merriami TaxID=94247 RepID=UPI003855F15B
MAERTFGQTARVTAQAEDSTPAPPPQHPTPAPRPGPWRPLSAQSSGNGPGLEGAPRSAVQLPSVSPSVGGSAGPGRPRQRPAVRALREAERTAGLSPAAPRVRPSGPGTPAPSLRVPRSRQEGGGVPGYWGPQGRGGPHRARPGPGQDLRFPGAPSRTLRLRKSPGRARASGRLRTACPAPRAPAPRPPTPHPTPPGPREPRRGARIPAPAVPGHPGRPRELRGLPPRARGDEPTTPRPADPTCGIRPHPPATGPTRRGPGCRQPRGFPAAAPPSARRPRPRPPAPPPARRPRPAGPAPARRPRPPPAGHALRPLICMRRPSAMWAVAGPPSAAIRLQGAPRPRPGLEESDSTVTHFTHGETEAGAQNKSP